MIKRNAVGQTNWYIRPTLPPGAFNPNLPQNPLPSYGPGFLGPPGPITDPISGLPYPEPVPPGPTPEPPPANPPGTNPPVPKGLKPPFSPAPVSPIYTAAPGSAGFGASRDYFNNGGLPIGSDSFDSIIGGLRNLFSGLNLSDFLTFLPPHSGIIWMKPDVEDIKTLGSREGQARLDVTLRNARKTDILKQAKVNLEEYQAANDMTPKLDAATLTTGVMATPNRPGGTLGAFRIRRDRRMRGRSVMAASLPPEIADIASSTEKFAPADADAITAKDMKSLVKLDVGLVQANSKGIATQVYEGLQ